MCRAVLHIRGVAMHAYVQSGPVYVVAVLVSIEISRPPKSAACNYLQTSGLCRPDGFPGRSRSSARA